MMRIKTGDTLKSKTAKEQIVEYHEKTKHRLSKYAEGPEFLDWDLQPDPYRFFADTKKISLALDLSAIQASYHSLYANKRQQDKVFDINKETLVILLGLSMGLSARKEYMGDCWSVRCNPSSGNLHPTEAYLITSQIPNLDDGIYHYLSADHSLQQRVIATKASLTLDSPIALLALTTINWREAWKYGERSFRYCQLDVGHALAAINYAAACLGWQVEIQNHWSGKDIAALCGIDRHEDFINAEPEYSDLLLEIRLPQQKKTNVSANEILTWTNDGHWQGKANRLDKHPMYNWPVIDQVEKASLLSATNQKNQFQQSLPNLTLLNSRLLAKHVIYKRRSAQRFDKQSTMNCMDFYRVLDKCLYRRDTLPWNTGADIFPMYYIFYLHRVNSLTPGIYLLANGFDGIDSIKKPFGKEFSWDKPDNCPIHLPFYQLSASNAEKFSRQVSCHQAIASDGVFSLSMLFQFEQIITHHTMNYRKLHWQAGLTGQLLYLEAESLGFQGTGIGCFFDDVIHDMLGIDNKEYQVLYNFTVGAALNDSRISTLPAYTHLTINL